MPCRRSVLLTVEAVLIGTILLTGTLWFLALLILNSLDDRVSVRHNYLHKNPVFL